MTTATLCPSVGPAECTVEQSPVWVRPMGIGWKFRVDSETGLKRLRAALQDEAFELSDPVTLQTGHYVFIGHTNDRRDWTWLRRFLRQHPDFRLMLDPA